MIVVLPFPFSSDDEAVRFLAGLAGENSALALMEGLRERGAVVHAASTSDAVIQAFSRAGFACRRLESDGAEADDQGLARGGREALAGLVAAGSVSPDDVVVVADPLRYRPEAENLVLAWSRSAASDGLFLASLSEVRDHPVQCHVPMRLLALDLFALMDESETSAVLLERAGLGARGFGLSHPFFFDWRDLDVWIDEPAAFAVAGEDRSGMLRAWPLGSDHPYAWSRGLYLWTGPFRARRLAPASWKEPHRDGLAPAYGDRCCAPLRLAKEPDGRISCLLDAGRMPANASLRLSLVAKGSVGPCSTVCLKKAPRHGLGGSWRVCAAWSEADPPQALLACVVAASLGSEYDFTESLVGGEDLWTIDPVTMGRVHPRTGRPYANRQEFPQFERMDGAVAAGRVRTLLDIENAPAPEPFQVRAFPGPRPSLIAPRRNHCVGDGNFPEGKKEASPPAVAGEPEWENELAEMYERIRDLERDPSAADREWSDQEASHALVDARLEGLSWKFQQMSAIMAQSGSRRAGAAEFDIAIRYSIDKTNALLLFLREGLVAQRHYESAPRGLSLARGVSETATPESPRAVRLPGGQPPVMPYYLTSDGGSRLYAACYTPDWDAAGLFLKDLGDGELRLLGENGSVYTGLWFDPEREVLYGSLRWLRGAETCAIDMFGPKGELLDRRFLLTASGEPRFAPMLLSGNASGLYFVNQTCRSVVALDKATMRVEDMFLPQHVETVNDMCASDEALYMSSWTRPFVQRTDLSGTLVSRNTDRHTPFPRLVDVDRGTGRIHALCIDHQLHGTEDAHQVLNAYDPSLFFVESFELGDGRACDMHVLGGSALLAVADYNHGIRLYDIGR